MRGTLSYADAVRLLGGKESKAVTWLDRITSTAMLGAAPGVEEVLSWFDAKADLVKHGHDLVNGLSDRVRGLHRFDRTQRLQAAHAVIVTLAFVESVQSLPQQLDAPGARGSTADLVRILLNRDSALPTPQRPYQENLDALLFYYRTQATELLNFVIGLAVWDQWNETERGRFERQTLAQLAPTALARYEELFRQLAVECPELAFWANLTEHQGTQHQIRTGLARLQEQLAAIATGRDPGPRHADLARGYLARLDRPVVQPGELPADFRIPRLGEAYVDPLCRVREIGAGDTPSQEPWWEQVPVRPDIQDFLTGYLTSPQAAQRPLLVLGQPGSGKSVLTQVLAARLPASDFLPVRVPLREVATEVDVQTQIEQAMWLTTGHRLTWPDLAASAGDALPLVLLDGFDELLQATGVSQSDYLERVRAFQQREAEQGRPVAAIVTTRTSVADRARVPQGCVALRLEPFDEPRVARWLSHWQASNTGSLTVDTAMRYPALATQPLLLLMLAIYHADGGDLRETGLRESDLYDRLLRRFALREVRKTRDGLPETELSRAVEEQLRRLSVVAFGMFNRGQQWITEPDLDADLTALLGTRDAAPAGTRTPLGQAESTLGRFFFIHRAEAQRDENRLRTYEFLHATFGEYLVARLTWQALHGLHTMAAAAAANPLAVIPLNDGFLHALLAHVPLSTRRPVLTFLTELAEATPPDTRTQLADLLIRLYRAAPESHPTRSHGDYRPRPTTVPAQHAAYSANLLLLTVITKKVLRGSELYGIAEDQAGVVSPWRRDTLLWRSQFSQEDWTSLVNALDLARTWRGRRRELELRLDDGAWAAPPPLDPHWSLRRPAAEIAVAQPSGFQYNNHSPLFQRRNLHFLCGDEDIHLHVLEPLFDLLAPQYALYPVAGGDILPTRPRALLDLLTLPYQAATGSNDDYQRCVQSITTDTGDTGLSRIARLDLALTLLAADDRSPLPLLTDLLNELNVLLASLRQRDATLERRALRHVLTLLNRARLPSEVLTKVTTDQFTYALSNDPSPLALEVLIVLHEHDPIGVPDMLTAFDPETWLELTSERPDLAHRAHHMWQRLADADETWPYPTP